MWFIKTYTSLYLVLYSVFFGGGGGVVEVRLEVGKQTRKDKCVHLFRK